MFHKWGLALLLIAFQAQAEDIPRPVFSHERVFSMQEPQSATTLNISSRAQGYFFEKAAQECRLSPQEVQFQISRILNSNESKVMSSLKRMYPEFSDLDLSGVRIVVDSFGAAVRDYSSFYLPAQNQNPPIISVDCQANSRRQWAALIGHELTHHLNQNRNLALWMDEMIAQIIEVESGPEFPVARIQKLAASHVTPSFFTTSESVFSSSEQYASNLLFGLYLRKLVGFQFFPEISRNIGDLEDISKKLREYTKNRHDLDWLRDYLTPRGLIRHFHLALSVNAPIPNGGSLFLIPGWQGFAPSSILSQGSVILAPGSSVRVSSALIPKLSSLPPVLEAYRVLKSGFKFRILKLSEPLTEKWESDHVVLINTSLSQSLEIQI